MTGQRSTEKSSSLGHPQLDRHMEFVAARSRPNTVLATASDLKLFFDFIGKEPVDVTTADVIEFHRPTACASRRRKGRSSFGRRVGVECAYDQTPTIERVGAVRLSNDDGRARSQPGAERVVHPAECPQTTWCVHTSRAHPSAVAEGPRARRGQRPHVCSAPSP